MFTLRIMKDINIFVVEGCLIYEAVLAYKQLINGLLQENLSSGFPTKQVSNQSPQLQRLARKLKFRS